MVGVFDSGFGGLTVLKHFLSHLPEQDYIYLGDNARAPYGSKSPEVIYQYALEAVDFLFGKNCDLIIFACNTASAQALRKIQQEYLPKKYPEKRVLGVIRPLVEKAAENKCEKIGVLGTRATIESGNYQKEIFKINQKLEVVPISAPLLVPLIEEGWAKRQETRMILRKYLKPLKAERVNVLILACTHYPILLKEIRGMMGRQCIVPDPGEIVALSLVDYLERHPEFSHPAKKPKRIFYTTDDIGKFKMLGEKYLGEKMNAVESIKL